MALLIHRVFAKAAIVLALSHGIACAGVDLTRLPLEALMEMRVTVASGYEQSSEEAPSAVSIITADEIRARGYRTIADALRSLPGLYVTDDFSYSYLGSRGFNRIGDYNSRFLLSVNGLRTNDAIFGAAYIGTEFPLDMALIERIEFAPGPGSSIYGSNAMLGVINIVTRNAAALEGLRVAGATGSDGLAEAAVSFGHRFDSGVEVLASASGLRSDGQDFRFPAFDAPATNGGLASGQNDQHYRRGYLRATYEGFDLEVMGGRRDKTVPSIYSDSDFLSHENRVIDRMAIAALRYQREIAPRTRIELRLSESSYAYAGIYPIAGETNDRDDARALWRGAELRLVSSYWSGHKLIAGVEMQDDMHLNQHNADSDIVLLDRHDHGRGMAIYAQDEFRVNGNWLLNAGARYDRDYSFGSSVNPRLALIGELAHETTVKFLYGSAFRAPNAYELYYQPNTSANTLGPERSRSAEAVIEQQRGDRWRWRVSAFAYRFDNLLDLVDDAGVFEYRNRGAVRGRGIEGSATVILPGSVRVVASGSIPYVRQDDGQRSINSPRYTATLAVEAPLAKSGVRGSFDVTAVGPRLDRDRQEVPAAVTANLVFTTERPWHGATFLFAVYNVFDRKNMDPVSDYFAPTQVPGPARSLRLGFEWRY